MNAYYTILLSGILCIGHVVCNAQTRSAYFVRLTDKNQSPFVVSDPEKFLSKRAILRRQKQNISIRELDLPVNPTYIRQVNQTGANVRFSSRWFNAVLVEATDQEIATIQQLPFVKGLEFNRTISNFRLGSIKNGNKSLKPMEGQPVNYGNSRTQIEQIGVDIMHNEGYRGEGMLIGILDTGFRNANQVSYLQHLFEENRIVATYDFVSNHTDVYEDDSHGLAVLSTLASVSPDQLYGTAYKASYLLLRTEDTRSESRIEEAYWVLGAEYADSAGVDVLNSSLGYTEFDDPSQNYTYKDMDGNTTLISRAAGLAAQTGMVVVVSAGNEGASSWRYISAPSDAVNVLAIGAVNQVGTKSDFSSFGPAADGRIKPDLVAKGQGTVIGNSAGKITTSQGTSFSAPLVSGLVAGFWQANPQLTATQVMDIMRQSGSQNEFPNEGIGYGIPHFSRANAVRDLLYDLTVFPNPVSDTEPLSISWQQLSPTTAVDAYLYNSQGKVVWQKSGLIPTNKRLTISELNIASGIYMLVIFAGSEIKRIKLLKK